MGRTALVKINILHIVLFLFQNLPILISMSLTNDLDKALRKFIWQNKKARIKAKYLQDKKENGGFALPNLILYYQASVLTWIKEWCLLPNFNILKLDGIIISGWNEDLIS